MEKMVDEDVKKLCQRIIGEKDPISRKLVLEYLAACGFVPEQGDFRYWLSSWFGLSPQEIAALLAEGQS